MPRPFRSLTPPLVLMLAMSAGQTGCETAAQRQRKQLEEETARRQAEAEVPTEATLSQIRAATDAFLAEHHPNLERENYSFTSFTPNVFLVGVSVHDVKAGNRYVAQFTAERARDEEDSWIRGLHETGQLLWVIDYATPDTMHALALRHGFDREIDDIHGDDPEFRQRCSWGQRSWLDDYLLWHYVFRRPFSTYYDPMGYRPLPMGYRIHDPGHPIQPEDAKPFQSAGWATGGRSRVFLGGSSWRPPLISHVTGSGSGSAFTAHGSGISGRAMGSVSRGGFGAAGHAAGASHGS